MCFVNFAIQQWSQLDTLDILFQVSGVAQWKRVGLITQRSQDRNLAPLICFFETMFDHSKAVLSFKLNFVTHIFLHFFFDDQDQFTVQNV